MDLLSVAMLRAGCKREILADIAFLVHHSHMSYRKSGGRDIRQPGQVRKEAAVTISSRVVPASTFLFITASTWPGATASL